jgi:choline dehydrogenase-like flavoprotein
LEGKRAVGVEVRVGGQLQQLKASREVLLSAGALQSPQLLMLSGIGPAAHLRQHGITVQHDLPGVGEHLHDHINVVLVVDAPRLRDTLGYSLGAAVRAVKGIFEWRSKRTGMLTTNVAEAGGFIKSRPEEPRPDLQLHFVIAKLVDHARKTVFGHGYSCHVCLLRPKSRGSVKLANADVNAAPLIDPNFFGDRSDMDILIRGFKHLRKIFQQPALAAYGGKELPDLAAAQTDAQIEHFIRDQADTEYHPVGSCRMGPGPMDVVDHQLRVHGLQGLRVVDASIMPSLVSGNTNAPTIMIAEKAADLIKAAAAARPASAKVDAGVASSVHETVGT